MQQSYKNRFANWMIGSIPIILGGFLRIFYAVRGDFPVNDGGLFLTMTLDLIQNHFVPPLFTSYNHTGIPYAYPWGAFYMLGFLNQTFGIKLIALFIYIPLFFNLVSLFLIFPIARLVLYSERQAYFTLCVYSILTPTFSWLINGGGVARSPASLFSLWAILFTLKYYRQQKRLLWLAGSVISTCITAWFHIEYAFVTAVTIVFLTFYFDRNIRALLYIALHSFGGLILLAPYWLTLIHNNGFEIFTQVFQTGYEQPVISLRAILIPNLTSESIFPVLAVIGFLGGLACFASLRYSLIIWLLLIIIVNPRSLARSCALPEAMIIATGLDLLICTGFKNIIYLSHFPRWLTRIKDHFPSIAVAAILAYTFFMAFIQEGQLPEGKILSSDERAAFSWISTHTEPDARFLIIPPSSTWGSESVSEWFPALTGRTSILTIQGYEWLGKQFAEKLKIFSAVDECARSENALCFSSVVYQYHLSYDYVWIPIRSEHISMVNIEQQGIISGCSSVYINKLVNIFKCERSVEY